jgi:HEAT repeat protein
MERENEGRLFAIHALGRMGPSARAEALPWLLPLLKDPDETIRKATAEALKNIDPEEASRQGIR